ncbi:unnamed protein product [Nesidiocoris tenuis]|uniref:WW domain-containing protein n=1 Tax=Nesidiocoris tenuis TaxID=355587 RepID=A0A6H5GZ22_9HEMI|nr:unnamed protein product [Nesidiocoris tenuis]
MSSSSCCIVSLIWSSIMSFSSFHSEFDFEFGFLFHSGQFTFGNEENITSLQAEKHFKGVPGCPNKSNIYHECTPFCAKRWGKGITTPDPKYLKKQARLLQKFPLPTTWKEVYDPGTGRHYYWDLSSDLVSWLPPGHPKDSVTSYESLDVKI